MSYSWPGNVRELENEIQRAILMCPDDGVIQPRFFSEEVSVALQSPDLKRGRRRSLRYCLETLEKQLLVQAMTRLKGNKTKVASWLGLSRAGLLKKLRRHGLVDSAEAQTGV
jgi:transcriptional regulator with PAS, ATPase and Fis domain